MDSSEYSIKRNLGRAWTSLLKEGDTVFVSSAAGEPAALIEDLVGSAESELPRLTILQLPQGGAGGLVAAARPSLRFMGIAASTAVTGLRATGSGSYLLSTIFQCADAIRSGELPVQVALVHVSPPDELGRFSLGIAVDFATEAVRRARVVVAQVNRRLPRTQGECFLSLAEIDALVEADRDLPRPAGVPPDDQATAVAANVVDLIPNEATIEIGVGEISTAVLDGLHGHRDLTVHTGLFIEPMIPLIKAGVVTDQFGRIPGRAAIANQATGSPAVVEFVHENSVVAFMPASYTHDPIVLRSQHKMRAINSAIEVDLFGRVNSEFIDGRRVGSAGGLLDFVRATREAEGGQSIIALRSTTKNGDRTKIVARLGSPGCCTIDADLADVVVTEHGVARLAGASADERVQRMIAISHPSHREQLARDATSLF